MPTKENNKSWWETTKWKSNSDGDKWDDQAAFCNQPYNKWKNSLVENFIYQNIKNDSNSLEIAPGHGRWTSYILKKSKKLILVDMNPSCIEFCKNKFLNMKNIRYHVNDGKNLGFIKDNSIDFIWSYDSFVHMEKDIIESYFREFSRVLKPKGIAIIHHAGKNNLALNLKFLKKFRPGGRVLYRLLSIKKIKGDGFRSDVSKEMIYKFATNNNLIVEYQRNSWGKCCEYNTKLFKDYISKIVKQQS